jgi:flagellar protein FlaG
MSSETFVSAMLLITGVVAAAILIVAVLPVIWSMVGTFSSASAATDRSMRTDFKIVTTYAKSYPATNAGALVTVWMKNVGTSRIGLTELSSGDVYLGLSADFKRATLKTPYNAAVVKSATTDWNYSIRDSNANNIWEPGETLEVNGYAPTSTQPTNQLIYFQLTLPSGVSRSAEFTAI